MCPWALRVNKKAYISLKHEGDRIISFERSGLFFVFNFHWEKSFTDYRFGISRAGKYKIVLDSDSQEFGGFGRINKYDGYFTEEFEMHGWKNSMMIYIPCRTALVFALDV